MCIFQSYGDTVTVLFGRGRARSHRNHRTGKGRISRSANNGIRGGVPLPQRRADTADKTVARKVETFASASMHRPWIVFISSPKGQSMRLDEDRYTVAGP